MPVSPTLIRVMSAAHRFLYRMTRGRVGSRVAGAPVLFLTTTGRKSGRRHTAPLLYLQDGDNFVVVASNGGNDRHPGWWLNLEANPEAEVEVGMVKARVRGEKASDEERGRLWPLLVGMYAGYDGYQKSTERQIPVVILRPMA